MAKALMRRFCAPPTTMVSTTPEDCSHTERRAALSTCSVRPLLPEPSPSGMPAWPGWKALVVMERRMPFMERRTVEEPCGFAPGATPLMTQFSRSRSSSRMRSCFW